MREALYNIYFRQENILTDFLAQNTLKCRQAGCIDYISTLEYVQYELQQLLKAKRLRWCLKLKATWVNSAGMQCSVFDLCCCVYVSVCLPPLCADSLFGVIQRFSRDILLCIVFPRSSSELWIHNRARHRSQSVAYTLRHLSSAVS